MRALALAGALVALTLVSWLTVAAVWTSSGGVNDHLGQTALVLAAYFAVCGCAIGIYLGERDR